MKKIWLATALFLTLSAACSGSEAPTPCGQPGQWLDPAAPKAAPLAADALVERLARRQVVLLGEIHDSAEDHRWQLHTLARLHARRPAMAIGLEMFPRRLQPVLDEWVAGRLPEREFLERSEWQKVWAYDARDYLPLFHFARMNRLPLLALNVERSLTDAVAKQGWEAVPEERREGVGRPAAPTEAYRQELQMVFEHHPDRQPGEAGFARFLEAQTLWDRAMAQGVAEHLKRRPGDLVAVIVGAGHVRHGHGIGHQLRDLGITEVGQLLTWDRERPCAEMSPGLADAVYVVEPPAGPAPRLGIAMAGDPAGVRLAKVEGGSVAEQAGLREGDIVLEAAGSPAKTLESLRSAVQRTAPGTWLPLKVKRGDQTLELVARFPPGA